MPSRDPKTGKPISGAKGRRRKHEKTDAVVAAGARTDDAPPKDDGRWARDFEEAGKPDLENPGTDLDYVRRLQLICLRQMATTAFPPIAQQEAWRRIKEMSAVVGMTSNRAQLEAKVRKLEAALAERKTHGSIVKTQTGASIKRPPTARGATPPGPRAVPEDATVSDAPGSPEE